ncbi:MAG: hypothetical protein QOE01_70 [Actinomycetota bacterium]|jgi:hypothetical protein|nr:hypothetical protein [Actinomycetota bacterium]
MRTPFGRVRIAVLPLAAASLLAMALPGVARAAATASCLDAMPVSDVVAGLTGHGLTVSQGTTPEPFTATVKGVITDGIAPGVDMIIADLSSPALTDAGGVWEGMSGSPVYDDGTDELIGSVSYGLSFGASNIAGITPAETMGQDLLAPDAALNAAPLAKHVALPTRIQRALVSSGAATTTQVDGGLSPIPVPLAVSGVRGSRLRAFADRLGIAGVHPYAAGSVGPGDVADPADIVPGGNFAATVSYGDLTSGGIGTTTAVCDGEALAFGHPLGFFGPSTMTAHTADVLYVQPDSLGVPFKVANLGGRVGTVDQDRLLGLHATLGALPDAAAITSSIASGARSRDGETDVTVPGALPDVAAFHLLSNFDRVFDQVGPGSSTMTWTAHGRRADGSPWEVSRTNQFADQFDISFGSIFELFDDLSTIQSNPFEKVTVDGVDVSASISNQNNSLSILGIEARSPDGVWTALHDQDTLRAEAGSRLNLRVTLAPFQSTARRTVALQVVVPPSAAPGFAFLDVSGGGGSGGGDFVDAPASSSASDDFPSVLDGIAGAPRGNDLTATLETEPTSDTGTGRTTTGVARLDQVVAGDQSFGVEVVPPARSLPAHVDGATWSLRRHLSGGPADITLHRTPGDGIPVTGDWDGNGSSTPAIFSDGTWKLWYFLHGTHPVSFTFGQAGDQPVVGDWNGDGRTDIGVYRHGEFLLRTTRSAGPATSDFTFGATSGRPVAGDWDGDGIETVGTYHSGTWRVTNRNVDGATGRTFDLGAVGFKPVVGDWDRDGRSEPGVYRRGLWLLTNGSYGGKPTIAFTFGSSTSTPLAWRS